MMTFNLYDKDDRHIGNEYHIPNEYGIIQIYHESFFANVCDLKWLNALDCGHPSHENENLFLVRNGAYLAHSRKVLVEGEIQAFENPKVKRFKNE